LRFIYVAVGEEVEQILIGMNSQFRPQQIGPAGAYAFQVIYRSL